MFQPLNSPVPNKRSDCRYLQNLLTILGFCEHVLTAFELYFAQALDLRLLPASATCTFLIDRTSIVMID